MQLFLLQVNEQERDNHHYIFLVLQNMIARGMIYLNEDEG